MKILVISNLYPPDVLGGYEMGCKQAVDALRAAGHDVLVLTAQGRNGGVPRTPGVERRLKFADVYDHYYEWKAKPVVRTLRYSEAHLVQAMNVQALGDVVEEFRPDVAYIWNVIAVGGLGLFAALQHMGVPWVMHLMDNVPISLCTIGHHDDVIPQVRDTFLKLVRGRFISCSDTTVAELANAGLDVSARTTVIPNWVIAAGGGPRTDYLPGGKLRILSAGAINTAKGVDITIKAAAALRKMGVENFQVDLYGPGTDPAFQLLIRQLKLEDRVTLMGSRTQEQLYALYPRYDVFCFPTWAREPFAFAPMEAMAFGCLAVISRACGVAEFFLDGVECVKCERTPESFAKALAGVARGDVNLPEYGRRAVRLINREYRIEKLIGQVEAVLREAVREGGGPARPASEAYHVALLAEKTFQCLINEAAA